MLDSGRASVGLTVNVLGPLKVTMGGQVVPMTTPRLRTFLVALALSAGSTVSIDRLAAIVWGEELPADVRRSVNTYVSRLRRLFGAECIVAERSGLRLEIDADDVDALRFTRLLDPAGQAAGEDTERGRLAAALALWRGEPFQGVASQWLEHTEAPRLTERYMAALERRIDLDIVSGNFDALIAELRQLTSRYRLRESLWVRLVVVLDRHGRQAEALECYETVRAHIADELGVDPGPDLQQVYRDLVAGRTPQWHDGIPSGRAVTTPRQLPASVTGFTGRQAQLARLDELLGDTDGGMPGAVVITAIEGTAGIGKTALAVHWAHRAADRFPDGQLYVNLRGFDPAGQPAAPAQAVRAFLDALGVPPQRIPADPDAQASLYRSIMADKRALVLADNARDADQVRPLIPSSPGSLVIITSRNALSSLTATYGAHAITLDLLSADEADQFLARRLGKERTAAEPKAAARIIDACAGLPLALAIVSSHAAGAPEFPLATFAAELSQARDNLDALSGDDPAIDVRTVFSWSYQALSTQSARLFRLLGLHPGPDISAAAAASLAGIPPRQTRHMLAELTRAHLLTEHPPGRFAFHDLLRAYATELAHSHDSQDDRHAATHRLLDHYLHTGYAADRLQDPARDPILLAAARPGVVPEHLASSEQALAWFDTEHEVLLAVIDRAATSGFDTHVWQMAWCVFNFLLWRGHWHDMAAVTRTALEATGRLGESTAHARNHRMRAYACTNLGQYEDAHAHLDHALGLCEQLDDRIGLAHTYRALSHICDDEGRYKDALDHNVSALELYQAEGHRDGQANSLNSIGWYQALLGHHREAIAYCRPALALLQELGDDHGEAATWDSLGHAHLHLREFNQAIASYQHSLDLYRSVGDRYLQATVLTRLGDTYRATGDHNAARQAWQRALIILDDLDHPDADQVRTKLRDLDQ